jgi:DNA primase
VIKNTFYNNTDANDMKIKSLLHQTSTTLIKITINSLKTKELEQFKKHLDELHILLNLIPEETERDLVLDKLTQMESIFRQQTTERSIQRLKWLKQKEHQQTPTNINKHQRTPTTINPMKINPKTKNTEGLLKEPVGKAYKKEKGRTDNSNLQLLKCNTYQLNVKNPK